MSQRHARSAEDGIQCRCQTTWHPCWYARLRLFGRHVKLLREARKEGWRSINILAGYKRLATANWVPQRKCDLPDSFLVRARTRATGSQCDTTPLPSDVMKRSPAHRSKEVNLALNSLGGFPHESKRTHTLAIVTDRHLVETTRPTAWFVRPLCA